MSAASGKVLHLVHHVERTSALVEAALEVLVCFSIFTDAAGEIGEFVRVGDVFIFNLDWTSVGGVQSHNSSLLTADTEADLLCKKN